MAVCAVFGCHTNNSKKPKKSANDSEVNEVRANLFRFPRDPKIAKIWEHRCGRRDKMNLKNVFICSRHFTKDHYLRNMQHELLNYTPKNAKRLKDDAVPTEELPFPLTTNSAKKEINTKSTERIQKRRNRAEVISLLKEFSRQEDQSIECDDEEGVQEVSFERNMNSTKENRSLPSSRAGQEFNAKRKDSIEKENYQTEVIFLPNGCSNEEDQLIEYIYEDGTPENSMEQNTSTASINASKGKDGIQERNFQTEAEFLLSDQEEQFIEYIDEDGPLEKSTEQSKTPAKENRSLPNTFTVAQQEINSKGSDGIQKESHIFMYCDDSKMYAPTDEELKEINLRLQKQMTLLREEKQKMYNQVLALTHENYKLKQELSGVDNIFSATQRKKLRLGARTQWTTEDMSKCAEIYASGPKTYCFLLQKGYPFPAEITVRKFVSKLKKTTLNSDVNIPVAVENK